ncbi:MAG: cyclic nucleotide-binding domain-containing protein [Rhodocyclaceae bacterium]|nr:cyclic nucleotide-binding domain-containing protein [Rhodocyclaceae bacterium]
MKKVIYILGQLNDEDVEWMVNQARRIDFSVGQTIIAEGSQADDVLFVLDGEVVVETGRSVRIATLGSGEILGEMSLVDARPASASVIGASAGRLMAISKDRLRAKLAADTGFAARFFKALALFLSERMRGTVAQLGYGSSKDLQESDPDELEGEVLENAYLAGTRFDRMMKQMRG